MKDGINFDYIHSVVQDIAGMKNNMDPPYEVVRELAAYQVDRLLKELLTKEEFEALLLFRENKEVLEFVMKNKDMLKRVKRVGNVLRVP